MSIVSNVPASSDVADDSNFEVQGKVVLILCGLIASGKSTFAEALQHHYPQFRRCNQDDLGDRRRVEQLARETLSQGFSVCVDRTNFNASQRSYWIEIAREFPGSVIWVIVFDTPYETCAARLQTRTSHPTIKNAEQGLSVLSRFAADFQPPAPHEGFDRILYVKPSDHPSPVYSRSDIAAILRRTHDSPTVKAEVYQSYPAHPLSGFNSFRGSANRGYGGQRGGYNHLYDRVPRGRGSNSSAGPPSGFRGWQRASFRGNSVGVYGEGRGLPHYPPRATENEGNSSEIGPQGAGSMQDPFVID